MGAAPGDDAAVTDMSSSSPSSFALSMWLGELLRMVVVVNNPGWVVVVVVGDDFGDVVLVQLIDIGPKSINKIKKTNTIMDIKNFTRTNIIIIWTYRYYLTL